MATAESTVTEPAPAPASPMAQAMQRIKDLDQRQKMAAAAAIALAIAMLVGIWLWTRAPDYAVLFSNLDERDGGAIVSALQQQNIPYRIGQGGTITIPTANVHETRLRLAAQGLPKGGLVGFEVMENQRLGVSQFLEQVNFQRALEGELSRTIQSISSVSAARVHLAIPKQTGFLRDEQKPSASVMVTLYPGRVMDPSQVAGIVHLISSSVPQMTNERVSVVDQNGNLLTNRGNDPLRESGLDATQISYVREIEAGYIQRIENILAPMVGSGNFKAQVTADLDFNRVEETAEIFKPNPAPEQAIRSQQTTEHQGRLLGPMGVPGALTNQPPVPATAPIVDPDIDGGEGANGQPLNLSRSATLNYEVDRTIQHVRQAVGQVRRLSVAVALNHRTETLPNGQTRSVPPSDEEIARITALVREAMGFNANRGDSVSVSAAAFAPVEAEAAPPLWRDPEAIALGKEALKYLVVALALAFVYFGVIRPLLRIVAPPPPEVAEEAEGEEGEEGEEDVLVSLTGEKPMTFEQKLEIARELAKTNPKMVANLIKEWMGGKEETKR
ncbi:MAG: flagellar basal-body MS-ring/collar protein FliF [Rhodocyclaceae bacterium]